jgi:23S rRNA pseudouridine1911/1915/1917 synthase
MPATESLSVSPAEAGTRLDRLLAALPSIGSREKARQALRSGKVSVDGEPAGLDEAGRPLRAGARVEIAWNRPGSSARRTAGRESLERAGVEIVFSDAALVVCNKPAGLLTDAADDEQAKHDDTLRKRVRAYLGGQPVWPAHRIDRHTTGLVCFARDERVQALLKDQWAARTPDRCYLAVLEGEIDGDSGLFRDWMAWDSAQLVQRPCRPHAPGGVLAESRWTVRERFGERATLLELRLRSGRRNQIRLQAQLAGHPLVGETLYRAAVAAGHDSRRPRAPRAPRPPVPIPFGRYALHAWRLSFVHPIRVEPLSFEAPLPDDLSALLRELRAGARRARPGHRDSP